MRATQVMLLAGLALPYGCKQDPDPDDTGDTDTDGPALACPGDDPNEPDDTLATATAVADGVHQDGILCANDADWYSFSAPPGCLAAATLTFGPGAGDLDLRLYDAQQEPLDGSFFGETVEEVGWFNRTTSAQALYLEVTGYLGAEGSYAIKQTCTASTCAGDEAGEPDARDDANALTHDVPFAGKICYGDSDWFEIPLGAGCQADLLLDYATVGGDLDLYLYDAQGALLDASESSDDDDELTVSNDGADVTVFVEVHGVDLANNTYALSYAATCPFTCPEDDTQEPDDALADANPLADGAEQPGVLCADDADWYRFTASPGCLATATLEFAPDAGDLDLELYDAAETLLNSSYTGVLGEGLQFYNPTGADQDMYLKVTGYQGDEGGYSIAYTCAAATCDDEAGEPDAADDANLIGEATPFGGHICYGDSDWFELSPDRGCTVDVLLDFAYAGGDLDLYLYDALGRRLTDSLGSDDDEQVTWVHDEPGPLFAEVRGFRYADNDYTIQYTDNCAAVCVDAPTDDDSANAATPITTSPTAIDGQTCALDLDWYSFALPTGCTFDVSLDIVRAGIDLDLYAYDAPDLEFYQYFAGEGATEADPERIHHTNAGAPMDVYLAVLGFGLDEVSEYSLTYEQSCIDCVDANEEDDDKASAKALAAGTPFSGTACSDEDWFSITAAAGCDIKVDLVVTDPDGAFDLFLEDPTTQVASAVGPGRTASLLYTGNVAGGPYFIRVEPYDTASAYKLTWSPTACP